MKKTLAILAVLFTFVSITFAASGDFAEYIYSTDIKACINGVWIDSYNIGGKTVVIVEDITNQFRYYDALRTLVIDDFSPERLVAGDDNTGSEPGNITGNIYETDIKTYYRGKELTSYSLNGKMAVVIEELGADNELSDIGGKFIWNDINRTIVLETMYRYPYSMRNMMEDKGYNIELTVKDNVLVAQPARAALTGGYILSEYEVPPGGIVPVVYEGDIIGYRCSFPELIVKNDENNVPVSLEHQTPVDFFYTDKVEDMLFQAGVVTPTVDEWLSYFKNHTISTIKDSFETDEYMFLYMFSSAVMSGSDRLIKINKADGTKKEYQQLLDENYRKRFTDVSIDRENEKVYFCYDRNYVINLKTDELRPYTKLETDIGIGSSDGELSEYDAATSRGGQYEYKFVSGGEEKIIYGFFAHEYYYAYMLPIDETFDFLNIKYSFENDVLTIDMSQAKPYDYEKSETEVNVLGDYPIQYLYVDKVVVDGEEREITYRYISGHFDNTNYGKAPAKPYVCNGKVYINSSFIADLYSEEDGI